VYETHHRICGAKRSVKYNRAQRQYRAEAYRVLVRIVTNHAGNKADVEEVGPSVGYNCSSLCCFLLANLHTVIRCVTSMMMCLLMAEVTWTRQYKQGLVPSDSNENCRLPWSLKELACVSQKLKAMHALTHTLFLLPLLV